MSAQSIHGNARIAVEEELKLTDYIQRFGPQIFRAIEGREQDLDDPARHPECADLDAAFVSECLPLAIHVVYAGSSGENLKRAVEWVSGSATGTDPVSILSALTFVYLVRQGVDDSSRDPDRARIWHRISNRVNNLLNATAPDR